MLYAVKRVLMALAVLQALFFVSMPLWPLAMTALRHLPDVVSTLIYILFVGALIWGAAEISNYLVGEKKAAAEKTRVASPGGMRPEELALVLAAKDNLLRVRRATLRIANPQANAALTELIGLADEGLASLPGAPERLRRLRRPLGYHLPKVAELAEGLAAIGHRPDEQARALRIATVLAELADQFRARRDDLAAPDLRMLEVEIRLLENALETQKVANVAANLIKAAR